MSPHGRITHYQIQGRPGSIGPFKASILGLPSVWSRYIFIAVMALLGVAFFAPALMSLPWKRKSSRPATHLSLWRRCLCVLLAYVMLISPLGFQQLAQAGVLYQNLRASHWGVDGETITYTYDDNGSVETKVVDDGLTVKTYTYEYNLQNRLSKITLAYTDGGDNIEEITEYKYNPSGIRVKSDYEKKVNSATVDTKTKDFLIDAYNHTGYAQVFKETFDDGSITNTSYIIGDDVLAQAIGTGAPQYLLYDGHGSTRQLSDSAGSPIPNESYSYDAYGVLLGGPRTTQTDLLYAGQMYDSVTDAYYLRARYYSPSTGRFNRMDPFAGNNLDPQSLHKYLYAHGNPVNRTDASGNGVLLSIAGLIVFIIVAYYVLGRNYRTDSDKPDRDDARTKFNKWYEVQEERGEWWTDLTPCPCTITVENGEASYNDTKNEWKEPDEPRTEEERLHPGIKFSMRSEVKGGHTNQCTYDKNGKLCTVPPRAGTVDFSPPSLEKPGPHLENDVYPLHWAVAVDHDVQMHTFWGRQKTPLDVGPCMRDYFKMRRHWAEPGCLPNPCRPKNPI